jgi:hypothetical protein
MLAASPWPEGIGAMQTKRPDEPGRIWPQAKTRRERTTSVRLVIKNSLNFSVPPPISRRFTALAECHATSLAPSFCHAQHRGFDRPA